MSIDSEFAEKFHRLSRDVELFAAMFDAFAKQLGAWDKEVDYLKTVISDLNVDLAT